MGVYKLLNRIHIKIIFKHILYLLECIEYDNSNMYIHGIRNQYDSWIFNIVIDFTYFSAYLINYTENKDMIILTIKKETKKRHVQLLYCAIVISKLFNDKCPTNTQLWSIFNWYRIDAVNIVAPVIGLINQKLW